MTNAIPASSLQQKTGSILRRVANGEHLVIEHRGIPIAVMMPLVEYCQDRDKNPQNDRNKNPQLKCFEVG